MIGREETLAQLLAWQAGTASPETVWQWAAQHKSSGQPAEDALVRDVIDVLADLPQDLVTLEEAEIMIYGLSNPPAEADLAQNLLWNHLDGLDMDARRRALAEDPFYGPFCLPTL